MLPRLKAIPRAQEFKIYTFSNIQVVPSGLNAALVIFATILLFRP